MAGRGWCGSVGVGTHSPDAWIADVRVPDGQYFFTTLSLCGFLPWRVGQRGQAVGKTTDMWLLVIVPIVAALYGVYLRYVLVKYPEMEEPARRKFIYVVGAVALVLITLDFMFAR